MKLLKPLILLLLLATVFSSKAQFQSQSAKPYLDIRPFMSLNVFVGGSDLNYTFRDPESYNSGIAKDNIFQVRIKSNQNWRLSVASRTPYFFSNERGEMSDLPSEILSMRKENQGSYININTQQQEISNGPRGDDQKPRNNFGIDLRAQPGMNYKGGSYSITVIFTLTPD